MNTQMSVLCECGARNSALAFKCEACGKIFDGRAGNTIPMSRRVTQPRQSVRTGSHQSVRTFHPPVPREWAGRPMALQQRPEVKIAGITFSADASLCFGPVPPEQAGAFTLHPDTSTNEAAGLRLAGEVWRRHLPHARPNVILLGDGEPTAGGGLFGNDKEAALEEARALKEQGARIATIGVRGPTMDFDHLRSVASAPALAFEAQAGNIGPMFIAASHSLTSRQWGQNGAEFVVFVIDESGSMAEDNKKSEVEEAVQASIEFLRSL